MKTVQALGFFSLLATTIVLSGCPTSAPPSAWEPDVDVVSDLVTDLISDTIPSDSVTPEGCQTNDECPSGHCNLATFTCVECLTHTDCPQGSRCSKWECVATAQCSAEEACPDGLLCEEASGFCVECLEDGDCGEGGMCVSLTCLPPCEIGCPAGWSCNEELGVCVECQDDGQCEVTSWCNMEEYLCYPDGCEAGQLGCVGNSTAQCAANGSGWENLQPCPEGYSCKDGVCVEGQLCVPNLVTCKNETTLLVCNSTGTKLSEEPCGEGLACDNGKCTGGCIPNCLNRQCGSSDCPGYECGECADGYFCTDDYQCYPEYCDPGIPVCINGGVAYCNEDHTFSEVKPCPEGTVCENGDCVEHPLVCTPGQTACSGNAVVQCSADGQYWMDPVPCPEGSVCQEGYCKPLPPTCQPGARVCAGTSAYLICLDNGQSWSDMVQCPDNSTCSGGQCKENPQVCVPGQVKCQGMAVVRCNWNGSAWETQQWCPSDSQCINGYCQPLTQKSCANVVACYEQGICPEWEPDICFPDCTAGATPEAWELSFSVYQCVREMCDVWAPGDYCHEMAMEGPCFDYYLKCTGGCEPQCAGKECGSDGCGGSCGFCSGNAQCSASGVCQNVCVPSCANKDCGSDGCGGTCGVCPAGSSCNVAGICEQTCIPSCAGKACGSDGCGGICGMCGPEEACKQGACITSMDCNALMSCVWACPNGDETCTNQCWADASPEARQQWQELIYCVVDICGDNPSGPCFQSSIQGVCKEVWNACKNCTPACTGKQCGSDGCNGTCGACPAGFSCDNYGYCLCQPQCDNKQCGNDLCGGSCGTCPSGSVCNYQGKCVCMPQCSGKECGSNGCGGSCGTCSDGYTCSAAGLCESTVPLSCGNGWCQKGKGETCDNCPQDCGPCSPECGDGYCSEGWEDCYSCPWDCGECPSVCGDQYCDYDVGESCEWCPEDCGTCNGYCGDYYCDYNLGESCDWCPQDCGTCNGYCGDQYCDSVMGESCDWCPEDCGTCNGYCGDYNCDYNLGENCEWCPQDCGTCSGYCGDYNCDAGLGETCDNCVVDCGYCPQIDCCQAQSAGGCSDVNAMECVCNFDPYCCQSAWDDMCVTEAVEKCGLDCGTCVPNCMSADGTVKQCGDDGCGGSCGACPAGSTCSTSGTCVVDTSTTCKTMLTCAQNCSYEVQCVFSCFNAASPDAQQYAQALLQCVTTACGFQPTIQCVQNSYVGTCAQQYQACVAH